jgi:hypothetical protein
MHDGIGSCMIIQAANLSWPLIEPDGAATQRLGARSEDMI